MNVIILHAINLGPALDHIENVNPSLNHFTHPASNCFPEMVLINRKSLSVLEDRESQLSVVPTHEIGAFSNPHVIWRLMSALTFHIPSRSINAGRK